MREEAWCSKSTCLHATFSTPRDLKSMPLENTDSLSSLIPIHSTTFIECPLARPGSGDALKSCNLSIMKLEIEPMPLDH